MQTLLQDLRYGMRMLAKSPGFTAVAVLTLALGIGANTAIFSVVNAVLLRALPFKDPQSLVQLRETVGKMPTGAVSYPNFLDWRQQNHVFSELAGYTDTDFVLSGNDKAERIYGELVTDGYFSLLGARAAEGRTFWPEENRTPGARAVAILSDGLWRRRFGADPAIVGRTVKLNEAVFTVVGVMSRGFRGFSGQAEAWVPFMMRDALWPQVAQFDFLHKRDIHWHLALGRLKPGVSLASAQAEMDAIGERLRLAYPLDNKERGVRVTPISDALLGSVRAPLFILLGAVGFVLLIACVNVANLLVVRMAARGKEIAVRLALGAGRGRLVRQLLTESVLVAALGGALGLVFASLGVELLVAIMPVSLPSFTEIQVDRPVLFFTLLVSIATGLLLGLLPALHASRQDLNESLKEGARGTEGQRGRRTGRLLAATEMALALVLMTGASLMLRSFQKMRQTNPGFRPDRLVTLRFDVPNGYQGETRDTVGQQIRERVEALLGVESAAINVADPYVWDGIERGFTLEGRPPVPAREQDTVYFQEISPNYFHTMGIPLFAGRDFTISDNLHAPGVVIASQSFAHRFWPGEDPIGKRVKYGTADSKYQWMTVVGVAGNTLFQSLRQDPYAASVLYAPGLQSEVVINLSLIARTRTNPAAMEETIRREIQKFDPEIPVYSVATLEQRLADLAGDTRSYASLLGLFAALAMILAAVGIYGVMAYAVTQRTHEIGIRMALGAQRRDVLRMVLGQGAALALIGVAIGLAGSLALTRFLASLLFGITATDPVTFAAVGALLVGVALLACYVPARRAVRVDPMVALRYE